LGGFVDLALIPYVPSVGGTELIILLVILLLLFGAKRIPELAKGLGSGIREFKRGMRDEEELREEEKSGELTGGEATHDAHKQEEVARTDRQS
jgi:sec-independent protein translocase protein TatA